MGNAAELCARECVISRNDQDEYAVQSYKRSLNSTKKGLFKNEIVPVSVPQRKGEPVMVDRDEEPSRVNFDKISSFKKGAIDYIYKPFSIDELLLKVESILKLMKNKSKRE